VTRSVRLLAVVTLVSMVRPVSAQTLAGDALIKALRQGGYVLVMRHTSSPREAPSQATANPDNVKLERQLDETGRTTATAMGNALRRLKIPIGSVVASPTYRALETVRFAQLPSPRIQAELGDGGQSMGGVSEAQSAWLKQQVLALPTGTNTILVTHLPNMAKAFPQETSGLSDGETLVFGADGKGGSMLVARIKIEQWPTMEP
jgi:phosphohistidine phosphatase SixA